MTGLRTIQGTHGLDVQVTDDGNKCFVKFRDGKLLYIEANLCAIADIKKKIEEILHEESDHTYKIQALWYHVLLDIWSSRLSQKWNYKRTPTESRVYTYSPCIMGIVNCTMIIDLIGPKDRGFEIKNDEEILEGNKTFLLTPLLKFLTLTLNNRDRKISHVFSSEKHVFVDPSDMTGKMRSWVEVPQDEVNKLGAQPIWREAAKFYILTDSWRSRYMKLPHRLYLCLAEFATWYTVVQDKNITVNYQDTENRLPEYILLTDGTTLLKKNKEQKILSVPGIVGIGDYENKTLFNRWRDEEEIEYTQNVTRNDIVRVFPKYIL